MTEGFISTCPNILTCTSGDESCHLHDVLLDKYLTAGSEKELDEIPPELLGWRGHSGKCCNRLPHDNGQPEPESIKVICGKQEVITTPNWKIAVDNGSGNWEIHCLCSLCYRDSFRQKRLGDVWDKCKKAGKLTVAPACAFHVQHAAPDV
jgi:hypothetical protein